MKAQVFYWRGSADVHQNLTDALESIGYCLIVVRELEEVLQFHAKDRLAVVIVDGSAGEADAGARIVELVAAKELYSAPLVFIAKAADQKIRSLGENYQKVIPVSIPFDVESLIAQIVRIAPISSEEPPQTLEVDSSHGGVRFASARDLSFFDDNALLPGNHANRSIIAEVLNTVTTKSAWLGIHGRRVTALSSSVANNMAMGPEHDDNIRTVGLMLNCGLVEDFGGKDEGAKLSKLDLLLNDSKERVDELAAAFVRSAKLVREELDDELAYRTIMSMIALLRKEEHEENSAILRDARCAYISEISDRACWANGYWNAFGAYRIIKFLRLAPAHEIQSDIALSYSRTLGEAVASQFNLGSMALPSAKDSALSNRAAREAAEEDARRLFGNERHLSVPVFNLRAGMRLAQPLLSHDGQVLLRANLALDDDLIARMWQLSALIPVRSVMIVSDSAKLEDLQRVERSD